MYTVQFRYLVEPQPDNKSITWTQRQDPLLIQPRRLPSPDAGLEERMVVIPKVDSVGPVTGDCSVSDFDLLPEEAKILHVGVEFQERGSVEIRLRRIARHGLQVVATTQYLKEKNTNS